MESNFAKEGGSGEWYVGTYNPKWTFGPINGKLMITKDIHYIYNPTNLNDILGDWPSPNVAFCINSKANIDLPANEGDSVNLGEN